MDLFSLGSSYTEFLCGTLPRYMAFAIYSYFRTVVMPKIMVPLPSFRSLVDTAEVLELRERSRRAGRDYQLGEGQR